MSQACVVHRGYFGTDIANIETVGVQSIKGTKGMMAIGSRKLSLLSTCTFLDGFGGFTAVSQGLEAVGVGGKLVNYGRR